MTLLTRPPDQARPEPLDGDPADGPPLRTGARVRARTPRWVWAVVVTIAVVLVAVPVGLRVRDGRPATEALVGTRPVIGAGPGQVDAPVPGSAPAPDSRGTGTAPHDGGPSTPSTPQSPVTGPRLARSAWLGLKVGDLAKSTSSVRTITDRADGQVLSEDVVTTPTPDGVPGLGDVPPGSVPDPAVPVDEARLVLRVPTDALDRVLVDLSGLGTVSYRSSRSQDVTDSYVDTAARIETMEQAVQQARALLVKATDLGQIIELENEVTRRQADLDSLRARLADLERRTTTADVTVTLWTNATERPTPSPSGFVAGLQDAWAGFLTSVGVILTGLAVLLPWLLLAVLVAVPLRAWLRRRHGGSAPTAGAAPTGPA